MRTQPVLQGCNSSVIKINDENVEGKFEAIEIVVSDEEISEEMEYRLIQYSELKNIGNDLIDFGDIVYVSVTLYDADYKELADYKDVEMDFVIGEFIFDTTIEKKILGKRVGDELEWEDIKNTVFEEISEAKYYCLRIVNVERYAYPVLTENFLLNNFGVRSEEALYKKIKTEVEEIEYELKLSAIEDELVEIILSDSILDENFNSKVEQRYQAILEKYEKYGALYNMSCEEILFELGMSVNDIRENAKKFQGEWELVLYYVAQGELKLEKHQIEIEKEKYALDNGYNSVEELIDDCGEQYLLEQVCAKEMKDYLYEKYVGGIILNEN